MHDHDGHDHANPHSQHDQQDLDSRVDPYQGDDPVWSGVPNQALIDEVAGMSPGRVADIGSGEGADAVWLAEQGWRVTGVEPSPVAQRRAHAAAVSAGVAVEWIEAALLQANLPSASFDLVTCLYPALFRSADHDSESALARLVAPHGTLLVVTHADVDRKRALAHGFDPDDYIDHACLRDWLGDGWTVEKDERRPRNIEGGGGAHHHIDLVFRARRS